VIERILIFKWGALGDVILATPHIEAILETHPLADVSLLTAPAFRTIFSSHPRLRVSTFPRKGAGSMWQALRWVRKQDFAIVYDLQGSERSALITRFSGARQRVGLSPAWVYTHHLPDDDREQHVFKRLERLLARAGVKASKQAPQIWPSEHDAIKVERWLMEHALPGDGFVLLHAGSSSKWLSKRWPEVSYQSLASKIEAGGLRVVWIGGAEERELNARLASRMGIDASEAFSITELALLARQACFAVTNDSGPMHVISTADIPIYAFFGPTDWRKCHAVNQESRVLVHPVACSPCYLPVCLPEKHHTCLRDLTPDQVFARLLSDKVCRKR
jgi:ADP-heptose:LPS heptosyltransferase